jgi:hypothetical protein
MRRWQPASLLVAAVVALGMSGRAPAVGLTAPPAPRCDRAVQVMATAHVAIVRGREHVDGAHGFYACTRRARRGTWLFDADPDGIRVRIEASAAGWFVAWGRSSICDKVTGGCDVVAVKVWDGRSGRFRIASLHPGPDGSALYSAYQPVVTRRGWAAWAVPHQTTPNVVDVYTMSPGGTVRQVAASDQIDPTSIATDGRRIYWLDGGQPRSAPLR